MLSKRGQITIFIIIGLVIIISFGLLFYLKFDVETKEMEKIPDYQIAEPIRFYVDSCVRDIVDNGIFYTNFQGGYYDVPNSLYYFFAEIPFYFYIGNEDLPDKATFESEFSKYVKNELPICINNFESFKEMGYKFEIDEMTVKTTLGKTISVNVDYPIKIMKQETTATVSDFIYTKRFNFDKLYNILIEFSEEHQKNPDYVPIGFLSLLAYQNNFTYDLTYSDENEVIYTFIYNDLFDDNQTLLFNFASKYEWPEIKQKEKKIKIQPIPKQEAHREYEFSYTVKAEGENIKFSDYTDLFDINENTGEISFIPELKDRGVHNVLIKAYDDKGNEDSTIMFLDVVKENNPPEVQKIENVEINVGEEFNYVVNASDPDGDTLLYTAETSLENFYIHPLTGNIIFTPEEGQQGIYTITIIVMCAHVEHTRANFNMKIK